MLVHLANTILPSSSMYRKDIQKCANFILRFCPIEAIEAVEAAEVNEAAEVLRPGKPLLRTSESSRHLNSALFLCYEKKIGGVES